MKPACFSSILPCIGEACGSRTDDVDIVSKHLHEEYLNSSIKSPVDIEQARFNMIEQQIRPWDVLDSGVLEVIRQTPRELFVPEQHHNLAFSDLEIPLPHGQYMMAPKLEARLLQALQVKPGDRVLEIGTGSGFVTACLARLGSNVDTIEWFEDLLVRAQGTLEKLEIGNARFYQGDAVGECADQQYDVIAVTASMPVYRDVFESRLAAGGRMFVVTGCAPAMQAQLLTRVGPEGLHCSTLFETCLPPLLGLEEPRAFQL